ncbi:MAG: hypothetical protein OXF07_08820 [Rhodobacter sp.]|nr:hypothetical protein [Rhodobacter sp.]MCY4166836.1 hypothetical protein [Rhodobacter sp.]MCY4241434.1 hypothetical protein [Rhodobacter sp.]
MELTSINPRELRTDPLEYLFVAFGMGLPAIFSFEWLIDRVDGGGKGGPWR